MKHLLNGVAIAAALVIAAPAWAQNSSGGNSVGTPGPNPGGPGLTPYSGGAPPAAEPAPAPMPPSGMPPSAGEPNSAMPPTHRQAHQMHMRHHYAMRHGRIHHGPRAVGDTTAELNRAELARIQSGNTAAPGPQAAPGGEPMQQQPMSTGRMPGPKPSGSGYIPPSQPPQPQ